MQRTRRRLLIGILGLGLAGWTPSTHAHREMLLDISHGQKPSSTGSNQIVYSLGECPELGGPALKSNSRPAIVLANSPPRSPIGNRLPTWSFLFLIPLPSR